MSKEREEEVQETKKGNKENQADYTVCSSHESIRGNYFFLALHRSRPKLSLKNAKHLWLLAGIPMKITSFLTAQILQHMIMTISMKKGIFN